MTKIEKEVNTMKKFASLLCILALITICFSACAEQNNSTEVASTTIGSEDSNSEEGYMTYVSKQRNTMRALIKRYYDIDICKSDYIMVDSAKIYEYCLKYVCPRELLYVSTVNDSSTMESVVSKYEPTYLLIPSTELGANLEKEISGIKYKLISITKGSGHFFCEHIKDDKSYQFDDMSPKERKYIRPSSDILNGISRTERKRRFQGKYLKPEIINKIREKTHTTDSDVIISLKYKTDNKDDYDERTFIIEEVIDQTFYAMAMLMKEI